MLTTTLYYLLAFIFFIACVAGIQKWAKLPQTKKDKVGLIVLGIFLIAFFPFISINIFNPTYFSVDTSIPISMLFVFLFIVFTAFFIKWYNDKYNKKINIGSIIVAICLTLFAAVFLYLKYGITSEKENIIQNVTLKTTVTNITFDTHKHYFKDMVLSDGQYLPMPEAMNNALQIGDSIYKNKKENYYTVVNLSLKKRTVYEVKTHERILGKAQ
jgi:ASC-1-like (ASCH) protein